MFHNKIVILNFKSGNVLYLKKYLLNLNLNLSVDISNKISLIQKADFLFIAGNSNSIRLNKELKKIKNFNQIIKTKKIIAICSGMQIFYKKIEEDKNEELSLSIIKNNVKPFKNEKYHIGWNSIYSKNSFFQKFNKSNFYFSHGYTDFDINNKACIAYTKFRGQKFCSIFKVNGILGLQFHPEKSGEDGKKLLTEILKKDDRF